MPCHLAELMGAERAKPIDGDGATVAKILAGAGLYPSELRPDEVSLESVFLELTREDGGEKWA